MGRRGQRRLTGRRLPPGVGRDPYQQEAGLIAAGDTTQARRMAQFMRNGQYISAPTAGDGTTYPPGWFPRYSPVRYGT
ncbi:hypothetical protein [Amycolatopsis taiwanensis]|uniref:hypothetical protein n=1 Tax=Amycolatopsis taiwanensis TaxID=342230 RepID=UPI0025528022|nr:hypothetical protein [Amycolatopsis taiwanensis]